MPYTLSEIRKRCGTSKRETLYLDFGITFWPAIAHLIEESQIICEEDRKAELYQMSGMIVSGEECQKIGKYLRNLLREDTRENFVLPDEKAKIHCRDFDGLFGPTVYSVYRERLEEFISFCEMVENGFKIE